jgi:hypothetical protein
MTHIYFPHRQNNLHPPFIIGGDILMRTIYSCFYRASFRRRSETAPFPPTADAYVMYYRLLDRHDHCMGPPYPWEQGASRPLLLTLLRCCYHLVVLVLPSSVQAVYDSWQDTPMRCGTWNRRPLSMTGRSSATFNRVVVQGVDIIILFVPTLRGCAHDHG